ncbi:hypothetical protein D6D01_04387 [Aureobasidium pullulans]|uniref:F-box domain-containing protein n=1 Tax=Aureobasidium pullulans TaxID=5580 RepID=A0A4S9LD34_AURPU|nr:hypothetical protein D6D01_04387 [Aureobasidium pullulans]
MPAPNLITLPNELIARIVECLEAKECEQLRLTHRHLNIFASRELAKICFQLVYVSMTRYSLETLLNICQHHLFGPYVAAISLTTKRAQADDIDEHLAVFQKLFRKGGLEGLDNAHHILKSYIDECHEQFALEKSGEGTRLLTASLRLLKERGQSVSLAVTDACSGFQPIGTLRAYRDRSFGARPNSTGRLKTSMRVLTNAAFRSGCRVDSLDIIHDCDNCGCGPDDSECLFNLGGHIMNTFNTMKTVYIKYSNLPSKASLKSLKAILSISPRLDDVTIELGYVPDFHEQRLSIKFAEDLLSCRTFKPGWKRVKLCSFPISQKALVAILSNVSETLEILELESISLRRGTWDLVIPWIRNNLSLTMIDLGDLFEVDDDDLNEHGYLAESCDKYSGIFAEGTEEVQDALDG